MFARHSGRYLLSAIGLLVVLAGVWALQGGRWWIGLVAYAPLLLFILWFFRDPERTIGAHVTSPADGRVLSVKSDDTGHELVIFMPPTGVHVNRAPIEGHVVRTQYRQGSHIPAFKKESERNERWDVEMRSPAGPVNIALIAGTVARRIHPYVVPGNDIKKGDRIGLIAFGSRCDLRLPPGPFRWRVAPGDKVFAGTTTVAEQG